MVAKIQKVILISSLLGYAVPSLAVSAAENLPDYFPEAATETQSVKLNVPAIGLPGISILNTDNLVGDAKQIAAENSGQVGSQHEKQDAVVQKTKSKFSWEHFLYGPNGKPTASGLPGTYPPNISTAQEDVAIHRHRHRFVSSPGYYPTGYSSNSFMPSQTFYSNGSSATTYRALAPGMPSQTYYSNGASATTYPSLAPGLPSQTYYSNGSSAMTYPPFGGLTNTRYGGF
jgi:hypothetical protein